jgi:cell wall-associated NlpC family hydrolase
MKFGKLTLLSACVLFLIAGQAVNNQAQDRDRVVRTTSSRPVNQPATTQPAPSVKVLSSSRPVLTNEIVVNKPLVIKTGESSPVRSMTKVAAKASIYNAGTSSRMVDTISLLYGIPYRYGSTGPNRYDCSGFVWKVFSDAGFDFERSSAATYWNSFEPATGDDRFKFGTLVFFNRLGHVGIVADSEGFYHASTSKGITYSKFEGYWEKRIVGFRKVPAYVSTVIESSAK